MKTYIKFSAVITILLFSIFIFPQPTLRANPDNIFRDATIRMDKQGKVPLEIRFKEGSQVPVASFFNEYKMKFGVSEDNELKPLRVFTDRLGQTHHRFKQYYKGLELAEVQYLVHEENGSVHYAHGRLVHGLNLDVTPVLSEKAALSFALKHINAKSYMWEDKNNEIFLKREQNDKNATYYPKGELMISAGLKERITENFRLVYRFDIYAQEPRGRYYVDVDAKNGDIIGVLSLIYNDDVQGYGTTLYNGDVQIVVSDSNFCVPPDTLPHFHLNDWNAYGGSGESWWMADTILGNAGGYADGWYEVLDTEPISLTGTGHTLNFFHRYKAETPSSYLEYDGWDGMNVRISVDGGMTWNVLTNPTPAYTSSSLYSFGGMHGEGPGIPGWAGQLTNWTEVTFDLSAYSGQTVQIRFAFASDPLGSTATGDNPDWFGWQIDNIIVSSSTGTLYTNDGVETGITAANLAREATIIEGNYRLRETGRGGGIATFDALNQTLYRLAVDFVDDDSNFTDLNDRAGVSVHWAAEATYDYYLTQHGRNSWDDAGARIVSYAHYNNNWNNAEFNGMWMTFGNGNGTSSSPLVSLDIIGHEFTHGVTGYSCNLIYFAESGALNESFSDIFGNMVEFDVEGTPSAGTGSWRIGEDFTFSGSGFRNMENPNELNDPDTYQGNFWAPMGPNDPDWGGIHTNNGVQNYWFYLLSDGGSGVNDNGDYYSVMGIGVDDAAQIAYRNLTVYLMPTSEYYEARQASINSALDLFGQNSNQVHAVTDAWYAVGVGDPSWPPPPDITVNKKYLIPGLDTLFLKGKIVNPDSHNVEVKAIIESLDPSLSDTLQMFDDGLHRDSTAGDNLFGGSWPVPYGERTYMVNISIFPLDLGYYKIFHDAAHFTTIGPVVVDHHEATPQNPTLFTLTLSLRNDGSIATATGISAEISTTDTNVTDILLNNRNFGDITPGQIKTSPSYPVKTKNNPNIIKFLVKIFSDTCSFWSDSITVELPVGFADKETNIPLEYALKQNYPNPFNPTTTIEFSLPNTEFVTLKVYNLLGEEVATLLSASLHSGSYKYEWDASQLASGVYLYKLEAGDYTEVRKMILMK
jgi:Zn-dependent metalloprotease